MSQPLSPAAQAVDCAIADRIQLLGEIAPSRQIAAAALRAVADQVAPWPPDCGPASYDYNKGAENRQKIIRFRLLAIAAELEGCDA